MFRRRITMLCAASVMSGALCLTPAVAFAAPTAPVDNSESSTEGPIPPKDKKSKKAVSSPLTVDSSEVTTSAITTGVGISDCSGSTHDPHKSWSFASVHATTYCPVVVPMAASVNLLRYRWYGWEQMASGNKESSNKTVDAYAQWYCEGAGTYTYQGSGYHRATRNGTNYYAWTENEERFAC